MTQPHTHLSHLPPLLPISQEIHDLRQAIHHDPHLFDWNLSQTLTDLLIRVEDLQNENESNTNTRTRMRNRSKRDDDCGGFTTYPKPTQKNKDQDKEHPHTKPLSRREKYDSILHHLQTIRESMRSVK